MNWWQNTLLFFVVFFVTHTIVYRRGYKRGYSDGYVTSRWMMVTSEVREAMQRHAERPWERTPHGADRTNQRTETERPPV